MSRYDDDEPIVASEESGSTLPALVRGKVLKVTNINNDKAPLEESKLKVMLQITGGDSPNDNPGLDLVAVLDVSGSMNTNKMIDKAITAMLFVIKKLRPIDRLSVVTFSSKANRLCALRQINESSQRELEKKINDLTARGGTNMEDGLKTGLKVLNERKLSGGRVVGIILMSDGVENEGSNAAEVSVGNVPVYTFGFGEKHDPRVLQAIAKKSKGGTYSEVTDIANLSKSFSQCLAGLLTLVVEDLMLTVTPYKDKSKIEQLVAGSYRKSKDDAAGSETITFGDIYSKEVRRVIVDLLLPATSKGRRTDVLKITCSYSIMGKSSNATPATINVLRTGKSVEQQEKPEVILEETRLWTAEIMKKARLMADDPKKLKDAQKMLDESRNTLKDVINDSNKLIETLRNELQYLMNSMDSDDLYKRKGRPFALSAEISHDLQRFAARGDMENLRLFATPRMNKYLEQAKSFDKDPSQPPPSAEEDVKEDIKVLLASVDGDVKEEVLPASEDEDENEEVVAAFSLARIARAVSFYIEKAFNVVRHLKNYFSRGH